MKKMINTTTIEGILYQHDLSVKISGENSKNPGTTFINGTIEIATDDACTNIVPVHYTYVTPVTSKGNSNQTFVVLKNIIDGVYGTKMKDGIEKAVKIRASSAIGLNEFYSDRSGQELLVSVKRNEGGFLNVIDELSEEKLRSTFKTDIVINKVRRLEADEERELPERMILEGGIFNFRNELLPVSYTAMNPAAMDYFESLDISPTAPIFTCVWGRQVSTTVIRRIVEESAFGEDSIREVTNNRKDFIVTGALTAPYVWDDESTITAQELKEALANREITLATRKKEQDEYRAKRNAATTPSDDEFDF